MTRILVVATPRSGTHMLVRIIARAAQVPWKITLLPHDLEIIKNSDWVIGVHCNWNDAELITKEFNAKAICIVRDKNAHFKSLTRLGDERCFDRYIEISNTFPKEKTVKYEEIVSNNKNEIKRVEKITGVCGIKNEPVSNKYSYGPYDWCKQLGQESNQ